MLFIRSSAERAKESAPSTSKDPSWFWEIVPDKIVEMILMKVIKQSRSTFPGHKCETFNSMRQACRGWARVVESENVPQKVLPRVYIQRRSQGQKKQHDGVLMTKIFVNYSLFSLSIRLSRSRPLTLMLSRSDIDTWTPSGEWYNGKIRFLLDTNSP